MKISLWCLSYNITVYIFICKYNIIHTVYIYYIILYNIVYRHCVCAHICFLCSKCNPVNSRCTWLYPQPPLLTVLHHSGFNSHLQLLGQAQISVDQSYSLSSQSHFCNEKYIDITYVKSGLKRLSLTYCILTWKKGALGALLLGSWTS